MKNVLRKKLQLLRQEEAKPESQQRNMAVRTLKMEAIEEALVEIAEIGTCGMRAFQKDLDWVTKLIEGELINQSSLYALEQVLFGGTEEMYDRMVLDFTERMQKAYGKYFHSQTRNGDVVYNPILNMYWNNQLQLWERSGPDGWRSFCAYMPHAAA